MIKCPFCNGEIKIGYADDEGNLRDKDYLNDAWSGLTFIPIHENIENAKCPIATHEDEILGSLLYENEEELKEAFEVIK